MATYEQPPRFKLGDKTREGSATWLAGSVVHDVTHSKQYHEYQQAHPNLVVDPNAWTGEQAEAACIDVQLDTMQIIGASQDEINIVEHALETRYWEVPLAERDW